MFDSRRPPRRQQNSKVETVDSSFRGIDGLGTDSVVWKDFAIVLEPHKVSLNSVLERRLESGFYYFALT